MNQFFETTPPGWTETTLGEVVDFKYGKSLPSKTRNDGNIFVYGSNGIIGQHSNSLTKGPTLIIGRKGSIGEIHISEEPCWPIDTTYFVEKLYGQPHKFWYFFLQSLGLTELNRATALPGLNRNDAYKISIKIPPLNEQKRIVARIEELQARSRRTREALDAIPDLLEQLRKSILAAAFRGDLTKEWRESHPNVEPATELLKRIRIERRKRWEEVELKKLKAKGLSDDKLQEAFANRRKQYKEPALVDSSHLPKLPKGWTWCWLSEVGYMNRGKSKHRPRNASHLYGGEYPFIQTGDIAQSRGRITNHRQTYSKAGLMQSQLWPKGTICITIAANIASTAILTYPACFPDSVVGIITDEQLCNPEYVEFFIRTQKKDLAQFAPATAQKNINIDILKRVVIPLAPCLEAEAIVELLVTSYTNIENTEFAFKKHIEQLKLIDQSILSKAFRGELVPQDPNDEPASILLERIRQEKARAIAELKVKDKRNRRANS